MKTTFWEKNKRTICNLILVAVLVALVGCVDAFAPSSSMWFPVLRKVCTFALAAVAMNLLNGFTGLFSLGQAGFMLLGAYAYAILTIPVELRSTVFRNYGDSLVQFQMPLVLALLAAGVVAAFFAFLIGLPVLRLKSDYLAIATLGFAEIVRGLVQLSQFGPLTNGPDPLNNFTAPKSVMPYAAIAGVCILLIRAAHQLHLRAGVQGHPRRRDRRRGHGHQSGAAQDDLLRGQLLLLRRGRRHAGHVQHIGVLRVLLPPA